MSGKNPKVRCPWPGEDPLYVAYHDLEWGVPEHDDRALFEKLILDGFQAGLSWITILRKRENFRRAFDGFVPEKIARWRPAKVAAVLADPGVVRNRQKVHAAVDNARAYLELRRKPGDFDRQLWSFTGGRTLRHAHRTLKTIPPRSPESESMSRELVDRGFRFVGPTICYAFMQAVGMVNDHLTTCFRYRELG
ncbi:MAG TPA: DNA-3-methyladenine glycosylase I [Candidatus Saccharimonadales bacterium]|nr:DNA-3-methyladenine glycosylase I [Candidatus Saccharimonadales bacterium]